MRIPGSTAQYKLGHSGDSLDGRRETRSVKCSRQLRARESEQYTVIAVTCISISKSVIVDVF